MAPRVTGNFRTAAPVQSVVLVDADTQIATNNQASVAISPVQSTGKVLLSATASNFSGTSVTPKLQHSYDGGLTFTDVASGAFTAITANGTTFLSIAGVVAPVVRVVNTYSAVTTCTLSVFGTVITK